MTSLNKLGQKINKDFIIMSCDSLSNVQLSEVASFHILNDASLTLVIKKDKVDIINNKPKILKPSNLNENREIFLINEETNRVLCINN